MAIEQLADTLDRKDGKTTASADCKQAPATQKPMSLDSPLLSGGAPRATLRTVYDAIADRFQCDGVREADVATFRWHLEPVSSAEVQLWAQIIYSCSVGVAWVYSFDEHIGVPCRLTPACTVCLSPPSLAATCCSGGGKASAFACGNTMPPASSDTALSSCRGHCRISGRDARPLRYDAMSPAYPPAAVRLLVMPLAPSAEQQAAVQTATAAVVAALPQGVSGRIARTSAVKHKASARVWLCAAAAWA
jgi:hypothetical protein